MKKTGQILQFVPVASPRNCALLEVYLVGLGTHWFAIQDVHSPMRRTPLKRALLRTVGVEAVENLAAVDVRLLCHGEDDDDGVSSISSEDGGSTITFRYARFLYQRQSAVIDHITWNRYGREVQANFFIEMDDEHFTFQLIGKDRKSMEREVCRVAGVQEIAKISRNEISIMLTCGCSTVAAAIGSINVEPGWLLAGDFQLDNQPRRRRKSRSVNRRSAKANVT